MRREGHAERSFNGDEAASIVHARAHKLDTVADLDLLLERIVMARVVMLGEASHGTH